MKVKTSITLSEKLLCEIDRAVGEGGNRSAFIEHAMKHYFFLQRREERGRRDVDIYMRNADYFNAELEDILADQTDPFDDEDE